MPSPYLSKSDFKASFDCRTKLYYRKNSYPKNNDDNEYVQFLADGGFMIEVVAKSRFPRGHDLVAERNHEQAFQKTQQLINGAEDAVVFEGAAIHGKYLARIDILRREGNTLHLIEVKSSSVRSSEDEGSDDALSPFLGKKGAAAGKPTAKWRPYLLDVCFQAYVLKKAFPQFEVKPWLCVVNKSERARAADTLGLFRIRKDRARPQGRPDVSYSGNLAELAESKILVHRDVTKECELLRDEVEARARELGDLIDANGRVHRVQESITEFYKLCLKCEYRFKSGLRPAPYGFAECWGGLADAAPHLLDLHRVTQIGSGSFPDPVPGLLADGKASLLDLAEDQLGRDDGTYTLRRHTQWANSRNGGREVLPTALRSELASHKRTPGWPLHFIDFEACNVALPYHAGLHPYERVAFQWSCHTVEESGALIHRDWLNTEREFPNFAFAQSLREAIGDKGTVYVWSSYEQATLKRVLIQINEWLGRDLNEALRVSRLASVAELDSLRAWIEDLLGHEDAEGDFQDSPRIRDLHKLALEHYFHPEMLGRTSIKVVLPAVLRAGTKLQAHPWFSSYLKIDDSGRPMNPYKALEHLPLGDGEPDGDVVADGTGAIRVYQDLIFTDDSSAETTANRRQLLRQYCKLDTLAMVMIWTHWISE